MKTLLALTFASLSAFTVVTTGCSAPVDAGAESSDDALSSSKSRFVGTFVNESGDADSLAFYAITFDADGTYTATGGCRPNPNGPSCFAIMRQTGTWTLAKSGPELGAPAGASELVLTDEFAQKSTYFYSLVSGKLTLRTSIVGGTASVFTKEVTVDPRAALVGSFQDDGKGTLPFYHFDFNDDGTYRAQGGCRPNPHGPSCFAIIGQTGTWALGKSGPELGAPGGASEILLTPDFGDATTYFYSLEGDKLSLSTVYMGAASVFIKQ